MQGAKASLLHAASKREEAKAAIWKQTSEDHEFKFRTLAFEITGGLGKQNQLALRQWAEMADAQSPYEPVNWAAPTRLAYWKQRLSVALMRGLDRQVRKLLDHALSSDDKRRGEQTAA